MCLVGAELVGQVVMTGQLVRNQLGRRNRGTWRMWLTGRHWKRDLIHRLFLDPPRKRKSAWVHCSPVFPVSSFRILAWHAGSWFFQARNCFSSDPIKEYPLSSLYRCGNWGSWKLRNCPTLTKWSKIPPCYPLKEHVLKCNVGGPKGNGSSA